MAISTRLLTKQKITTKIVGVLITFLLCALSAIGYTLLLSWQLEGGAGAINDAGSLRKATYRLTLSLNQYMDGHTVVETAIHQQVDQIGRTFANLQQGDPTRPLLLPKQDDIQSAFAASYSRWQKIMLPQVNAMVAGRSPVIWHSYLNQVDDFVNQLDHLVSLIEQDNSSKTFFLRSSQMFLIGMALLGTVAVIYLFFLMIIRPVTRLQSGISRMGAKDFTVRLPVESKDEFGQLSEGFNQMADRLEDLYGTLEKRVQQKTKELAEQNRDVSLLYEITAFLSKPQSIEELCQGYLDRLMQYFHAEGGTVRLYATQLESAHMVVYRGISELLAEQEHCIKIDDCLCGKAVRSQQTMVHQFGEAEKTGSFACAEEGFNTVSMFHIRAGQHPLGLFNLHFKDAHIFTRKQLVLLETLGQHAGAAIQNLLLAASEREMAVAAERNLVAQGLHDSIAQGLSFLNLQVQLLEDSIDRNNQEEVSDTLTMLKMGVQESYDDVRELLTNFRARIDEGDFTKTLQTTLDKFRRQTGLNVAMQMTGTGAPLQSEQQLQVLFIVQEALSNIRKHAHAKQVTIKLENEQDFRISIADDGKGFDFSEASRKEGHIGLSIMQERAERIQGELSIDSRPGHGTKLDLFIHRSVRFAS